MKRSLSPLFLLLSFVYLYAAPIIGQEPAGDVPTTVKIGSKVTVPMSLYGNKPVVEVRINGKGPFALFLDTGAGATVIDQSLADELRLVSSGTIRLGDPADPQAVQATKDRIDELSIGDLFLGGFNALATNRSELYKPGAPRGVLGMPLFRSLLLTIDYPSSQITVEKGSLPPVNGADIIGFKFGVGGVFQVSVQVQGTEQSAHIDTGSGGGVTFPVELMDKIRLKDKPVEVGRGRTVGGETVVYGGKLDGSVALGSYKVADPDVRFFGRLRNLNLGYQFLNVFAITLDQQNLRIRFTKRSQPAGASIGGSKYADLAGVYGERRITAELNGLYLQRISGPQGEGPKIKLTEVRTDEFALEGQSEVRLKFKRTPFGSVDSLSVLDPKGDWETSARMK